MHPTAGRIKQLGWTVSVTHYSEDHREGAARMGARLPLVRAEATRRGRRISASGETEAAALADLLAKVRREMEVPA